MPSRSKLLLLALICLFLGQLLYYYPRLSPVVASHFNAAGEADGWMSKSSFVVFEIVVLGVIAAEFALLPRMIEKMPDALINLPHKEFWLAPERRAATFGIIRDHFEWLGAALLALFVAINQLIFRANLAGSGLPAAESWLAIAAFVLCVIGLVVKMIVRFKRKI